VPTNPDTSLSRGGAERCRSLTGSGGERARPARQSIPHGSHAVSQGALHFNRDPLGQDQVIGGPFDDPVRFALSAVRDKPIAFHEAVLTAHKSFGRVMIYRGSFHSGSRRWQPILLFVVMSW
jgi:hypothetical protein